MKKILLSIFVFFIFVELVNADYTCVYEATIPPTTSTDSAKKIEGKITVKTSSNEFISDNFLGLDYVSIIDSKIDSNWNAQNLIELFQGKCPSKVTACYGKQLTIPGGSYATITAIIMNNTLTSKMKYPFNFAHNNIGYAIQDKSQCQEGVLNEEKSTGEKIEVEFPCDFVEDRLEKMDRTFCEIGEEGCFCEIGEEGCTSSLINSYNNLKIEINSYCEQILKYQNTTNDCVFSCLNVQQRINKIEGIEFSEGQCGFSGKLITWIANIVKWGKYLVPVVVIVMGIIDFIQAIAADKDDGMKKAQGRFIKRLIAAALIFIIPFIIEFVLDKMGFDANGCGIIDL